MYYTIYIYIYIKHHSLLISSFYEFEWSIETLSTFTLPTFIIIWHITSLRVFRTITDDVLIFAPTVNHNLENSGGERKLYLLIFLFTVFFFPKIPKVFFFFLSFPFCLENFFYNICAGDWFFFLHQTIS